MKDVHTADQISWSKTVKHEERMSLKNDVDKFLEQQGVITVIPINGEGCRTKTDYDYFECKGGEGEYTHLYD